MHFVFDKENKCSLRPDTYADCMQLKQYHEQLKVRGLEMIEVIMELPDGEKYAQRHEYVGPHVHAFPEEGEQGYWHEGRWYHGDPHRDPREEFRGHPRGNPRRVY